jgi:hypothetical protein
MEPGFLALALITLFAAFVNGNRVYPILIGLLPSTFC